MAEEITGTDNARMEWKTYWRNVVKHYWVKIEGWPPGIPFKNLSDGANTYDKLETLLRKWRCGAIYWKRITQEELDELDSEQDRQIESRDIEAPAPHRRRSDLGQKRKRPGIAVDTDNDADDDEWQGILDDNEDYDPRPTKRVMHVRATPEGPTAEDN